MDDHLKAMDRAGDAEAVGIDFPERTTQVEQNSSDTDAPGAQPACEGGVDPCEVVEALLFASDAPLSPGRLAELVGAGTPTLMRKHIEALNEKYAAAGLTFRIEKIAGGFQLLTQPEFRPWLSKLSKHRQRTRLSNAALETLSIVAYKQPVIRAEIEAVRGVACGDALNRLREMGLVKIIGRADMVGRPMLYGTTRRFLDVFGLGDVEDLPPLESIALRRRPEDEEAAAAEAEDAPPAAASA